MLIFELFPLFVTLVALVVGILLFVMNRQATAGDPDARGRDRQP